MDSKRSSRIHYEDNIFFKRWRAIKQLSPEAKGFTNKKGSRYKSLTDRDCEVNRQKSKVRSRVEHEFGVLKRQFGYNKVRYRGLDKNAQAVFTKCALINLYLVKKQLLTV